MRTQRIIDFGGMEFRSERHPNIRLRQKSRNFKQVRESRNLKRNVKNVFSEIFGF